MTKYVDTKELERTWGEWMTDKDPQKWESLSMMVYKICDGVSTRFNPKSDDEKMEHIHDATMAILDKINSGKLQFIAGRAPVFNLLTTTAFHLLYSKMNKAKRLKQQMDRYKQCISTKLIDIKSNERSQNFIPVCSHYNTPLTSCQVLTPKLDSRKTDNHKHKYVCDRYPNVIPNSFIHDKVKKRTSCLIKCETCGRHVRVLTCSLFQVKLCKDCKTEKKHGVANETRQRRS